MEPSTSQVPSSLRLDVFNVRGGIGGELTDDFFEDIFQCHQTLDVTVFV